MLRECILESSLSAFYADFNRNSKVLFSNTGSFDNGSALSIAIIVGGRPPDLLRIVLKFSVVILSKALSSISDGNI